jgi:hypothetical protein
MRGAPALDLILRGKLRFKPRQYGENLWVSLAFLPYSPHQFRSTKWGHSRILVGVVHP